MEERESHDRVIRGKKKACVCVHTHLVIFIVFFHVGKGVGWNGMQGNTHGGPSFHLGDWMMEYRRALAPLSSDVGRSARTAPNTDAGDK